MKDDFYTREKEEVFFSQQVENLAYWEPRLGMIFHFFCQFLSSLLCCLLAGENKRKLKLIFQQDYYGTSKIQTL